MKIVIIANSSKGLYGFRQELIQELIKKYTVIVITPNSGSVNEIRQLGCDIIEVPVDRRGINPFKDYKTYRNYRRVLKNIAPDLVITYTIKPNIYGGYAAKRLRIAYATNITGLGTAFQNDSIIKKLVVMLYKIALSNSKVVFFENAENLNIIVHHGIIKKEKTCLLNGAGVNVNRFCLLDYPKNNQFHFLFMGRVMREKGIDELFYAMNKIVSEGGNAVLDVLGDYDENCYSVIIKKYEAQGWLKYYGYQNDTKKFIKQADCFVLPSWHEGMSNTNLECASSGPPVITSNIYGCKEAVEDGVSGFLVEKKNPEELYKSMKKIMEMPREKRMEMGIAGRKRMIEMFDKRVVVSKTVAELMKET